MNKADYLYTGKELELFSAAKNWKHYIASLLKPFIQGDVLEAGTGIGSNTALFFTTKVNSWTLLEPDVKFYEVLKTLLALQKLPGLCTVFHGYTSDIKEIKFDTVIYIDVIEHIEDDRGEIAIASHLLKKNGRLIILSPAHNYLMSAFDKAIGHYRRYSDRSLMSIAHENLEPLKIMYVDSVGFFASLANRLFLKQQYPSVNQINFWDKWMIPFSKVLDRILFYKAGKTIIAVWQKK